MKAAYALSERERTILRYIVESYVQNATPVGSRFLVKKFNLGLSPATIRNVMNDLEDMGYLSQPHVSAGRVPTDKGYRYYVDSLLSSGAVNTFERKLILHQLRAVSPDVDEILEVSSQVLGQISSQLGIVLEPSFYKGIFRKMELVSISESKILAVITIESGLVKTIMMEIKSQVSRDQLHETSQVINERLSGLSLKVVKESIDERLKDTSVSNPLLMRTVVKFADRLFAVEHQIDLHLGGALNIISNPEFSDAQRASKILELIDSKENISNYLSQAESENVTIKIGHENQDDLLAECSVISTKYYMGNVSGTLGVVGPTRMQYSKIIPLVGFMAETLTKKLCSVWS